MWAYWAWVYLVRGRVSNYDACVNAEGGVEENPPGLDVHRRDGEGGAWFECNKGGKQGRCLFSRRT